MFSFPSWRQLAFCLLAFPVLMLACGGSTPPGDLPLHKIKLPEGFSIELFAEEVKGARSMAWGDKGTLFVGTRRVGKVYALVDTDGDKRPDKRYTLAKGLYMPNGVAFKDGDLYVAEVNRVIKFKDIENNLGDDVAYEVVSDTWPSDQHHGWKYIAFGPDGKLYVPVGAPCNICLSEDEIYATICRMNPDGSDQEVYVHGVRNSVGFDWDPATGDLWFTDNGRDWFGDDLPGDELNHVTEKGQHFGYPFCHQGDTPDDQFTDRPCSDFVPPAQTLGPHVAALGMKFYRGKAFPKDWAKRIFIPEHGSWNRATPLGYRITTVDVGEDGKGSNYQIFAEGWLDPEEGPWGRPVDLLEMTDGSFLLSDDFAGVIYRISYNQ